MPPHFRFGSGDASRALLRLDVGHDGRTRAPPQPGGLDRCCRRVACVAVVVAALVLRDRGEEAEADGPRPVLTKPREAAGYTLDRSDAARRYSRTAEKDLESQAPDGDALVGTYDGRRGHRHLRRLQLPRRLRAGRRPRRVAGRRADRATSPPRGIEDTERFDPGPLGGSLRCGRARLGGRGAGHLRLGGPGHARQPALRPRPAGGRSRRRGGAGDRRLPRRRGAVRLSACRAERCRKLRTGRPTRILERSNRVRYRPSGACDPTIHRPPCPPRGPGLPRHPGRQPAVVVAPGDPGRLRGRRPRAVGVRRARPGPAPRRPRARPGSPSWPPTRRTSRASRPAQADLDAYLTEDRWYQRTRRRRRARARSPTSPRSTASPRCCRSTPAASASSPATT